MIDIREHGGIFGGRIDSKPLLTLDFPPCPINAAGRRIITANKRFVAVENTADYKIYIYDRKTKENISSFRPMNNNSYYVATPTKGLILGDWFIGPYTYNSNRFFFKQNIKNPALCYEISVQNPSSQTGFYISDDMSYGYLCEYNTLKKFNSNGILLWEARTNSNGGFFNILFENNGIVYVGKNTNSAITPVNSSTGVVYSDIQGTTGSVQSITSGALLNNKMAVRSSDNYGYLYQLSEDGKTGTFIKGVTSKKFIAKNKDGFLIGDASASESGVQTHLYDENLNIIKPCVSSVSLSGTICSISNDEVFSEYFRPLGVGADVLSSVLSNIN